MFYGPFEPTHSIRFDGPLGMIPNSNQEYHVENSVRNRHTMMPHGYVNHNARRNANGDWEFFIVTSVVYTAAKEIVSFAAKNRDRRSNADIIWQRSSEDAAKWSIIDYSPSE